MVRFKNLEEMIMWAKKKYGCEKVFNAVEKACPRRGDYE